MTRYYLTNRSKGKRGRAWRKKIRRMKLLQTKFRQLPTEERDWSHPYYKEWSNLSKKTWIRIKPLAIHVAARKREEENRKSAFFYSNNIIPMSDSCSGIRVIYATEEELQADADRLMAFLDGNPQVTKAHVKDGVIYSEE